MGEIKAHPDAHEIVDAARLFRIGKANNDVLTTTAAWEKIIGWAKNAHMPITDPFIASLLGNEDTLKSKDNK